MSQQPTPPAPPSPITVDDVELYRSLVFMTPRTEPTWTSDPTLWSVAETEESAPFFNDPPAMLGAEADRGLGGGGDGGDGSGGGGGGGGWGSTATSMLQALDHQGATAASAGAGVALEFAEPEEDTSDVAFEERHLRMEQLERLEFQTVVRSLGTAPGVYQHVPRLHAMQFTRGLASRTLGRPPA